MKVQAKMADTSESAHVDSVVEEDPAQEEREEKKMINKKPCEVCGQQPWKYRCPRCSKLTCCLDCVKQHKADTQCDGKRDKTAFVDTKDMNDSVLHSDYQFMESLIRKVDAAKREERMMKTKTPKFLQLIQGASRRRRINLCLLPTVFSRHVNNSTYFNFKEQTLYWHVEWDFVDADAKYEDRRLSEDLTLSSLLAKYLDPVASDPVARHQLQSYGTHSKASLEEVLADCRLLLRDHTTPEAKPRYFELKPSLMLSENLHGKTVVEYPTILVVKKTNVQNYPLSPACFPDPEFVKSWKTFNRPEASRPKRRRFHHRKSTPWSTGRGNGAEK